MKPPNLFGVVPATVKRARGGHKKDVRQAASWAAWCLSNDEPLPPALKQFLIDGLQDIEAGKPAFTGKRGIKDSAQKGTGFGLYMSVWMYLATGQASNPHQAAGMVQQSMAGSKTVPDISTILRAYKRHFPK
jgi:hypothetical protein